MQIKSIIFGSLLIALTGCSDKEPPKEGPNGSWWVGGADGGVFVHIEDDSNPADDKYQGTVYYEFDKSIWYQGAFQLKGNLKFTPENQSQYLAWDGERLHLVGSSYLEAVGEYPDNSVQ